MKQVQRSTTLSTEQSNATQRAGPQRFLFSSLLVGGVITLLLTLIEVSFILLFNPFHVLGESQNRFFALLILPLHAPVSLLVLLSELLVASMGSFLLAQPVALISYLRAVYRAQEAYHKLYIPLTAVANIRKAGEYYQEYPISSPLSLQDEQISILDLVQLDEFHQLILGLPGAGKTTALRVYQYVASSSRFSLAFSRQRIPVYIPMKNYSLFLKQQFSLDEEDALHDLPPITLFSYLQNCDLPGMHYLKPYLQKLSDQGRLLLLCDGLNEIDSSYLPLVSRELIYLMRETRNRLVMTCREVDYREQPDFVQLVDEGQAVCAVIYPLRHEQVHEFVELYVQKQDNQWQHTAGQILQVIDRSRLRYHCTNPMMLFTLMGIIDQIGVERGKQIDTRGRLLREYVRHLIHYERQQAKWSHGAPTEQEIVNFLSEVACAARWANDRNAIQLHVTSLLSTSGTQARRKMDFQELADELRFWLDEHPAQGPFVLKDDQAFDIAVLYDDPSQNDLLQMLQFALSAALIEISPSGVLSFRHELIAEYFVAEYFFRLTNKIQALKQATSVSIRLELLENVSRWSEPVALWAGLLDHPLELAERFGSLGLENPGYVLQALALGLVCVGVLWAPPQVDAQRTVILPSSLEEALSIAVRNKVAREELASIFTRCAEEGGQEVYRSLLPLIMVEGIGELLILLDQSIVPDLLFAQLQDAADNIAYETQVKRLTRILGHFGGVVVERAIQLSVPASDSSARLRAAAINILGGTHDSRAVEPLLARLRDADPFIAERATNALIRLGPSLTLGRVLQLLEYQAEDQAENPVIDPLTTRVHHAALAILGRFLEEQDAERQVSFMQYQHILERIVPVLTSHYQAEPSLQLQARKILIREGRNVTGVAARDHRWEKVIEALISYLTSQNDIAGSNVVIILQEIGAPATPRLIDLLNHPEEIVRVRVVSILQVTRDLSALPGILQLLDDPSPIVQKQVAAALCSYAPDSIVGLVNLILNGPSDVVAERSAQILVSIGLPVVKPVIDALPKIIPGRTRLLVQVLEMVHDPCAVPALITLLQTPQLESLLSVAIVRALGQFQDPQVVPPLLSVLSSTDTLLYEQTITVLSQLGKVALPNLIAALDVKQPSLVTKRVQRALLGITPFPGEQLIRFLEESTQVQMEQIMAVFVQQGSDAAQVLVKHLLYPNKRVRDAIHGALEQVPGAIAVPALLEALSQLELCEVAGSFLLKYPDAAIAPLVDLLGEPERSKIAATILPQFGPMTLRPLITGLDDRRQMARQLARQIVVTLVRESQDEQVVLREVINLFNPPPPVQAHKELIGVLTQELADISLPVLLMGLEDAYLVDSIAEAFVHLAHKPERQTTLLDSLVESLFMDERRRGAEVALTRMGASAVLRVGELITDQNRLIAKSAKQILRDIGVPALRFIWTAYSDRGNKERREAAIEVFRSMRIEAIKDELVALLVSDQHENIAMAVALLLERIDEEAKLPYEERVMVPELVEYIQTHTADSLNLHVIAQLLLIGEHAIVDHLIQAVEDYPQPRKQLIYILLLLGKEAQQLLLQVFNDPDTAMNVRFELAAVLGMMSAPQEIISYARSISSYGLSNNRAGGAFSEQLSVALRALGGLLASGYWNAQKLLELRDASKSGDPARELFNILLGWRYEPQIAKLQSDLEVQREKFKREIVALTERIVAEQRRAQTLESDLEKLQQEHGFRGEELHQVSRERDAFRAKIDQLTKEKSALQSSLDQATKEKASLAAQLERLRTPQTPQSGS
jgi:HEAT repeat protein